MPSVSKQQQKFFGLVRALQKGDVSPSSVTKKARDAAKDMKKSDVKKYAATKHKGLPRKVKGETKVKSLIKKMVREILDEQQLDEKCQPGYMTHPTRKTKKMFGKTYRNCVKKENTAPNHDGKAAPFGSGYKKAKNLSKILKNLNEKLSKSEIKKMRDKFDKTGKLPPHLMKLAKLMDKHTEVRNIVVPGLEWMSKLGEGKLTEAFDLKKLEDAIKMFQKKIKKQGRVTNARDEEHLEKLIKVYKEMGGKKIKEGKLKENRKQIAQTILQQLGGNKFIAMTGAKNLGFDSKGSKTTLSFKIGRNAKSINYVKVDYISGKDLYDMSFFRLRAGQLKLIKKVSSIYGDQLQKFFTKNTGLYTRL